VSNTYIMTRQLCYIGSISKKCKALSKCHIKYGWITFCEWVLRFILVKVAC
ncbi:hypothetical protein L9F63_021806, partial [Diploptera punctata]